MRRTPYVPRPSFTVEERIEEITRQEVRFAIEPLGPSKFRLKPVEGRGSFLVSIGLDQTCSCHEPELCTHILYVMLRFFSVPVECDVLWQTSLTEHEIDQLLNHRIRRRPEPHKQPLYKTKSGKPKVKRLPITADDVCPICYDSLTDCDSSKVAWCRSSCGGNFHRKCVKLWIENRRAQGEEQTCPMCRERLDMLGVKAAKKPPVDAPPSLSRDEIRDLMTREIGPDDYHLLLRLDHAQAQSQGGRAGRPKPLNERIRAANRILAQPPSILLEVTGAAFLSDRAHRQRTSAVRRAPSDGNPFVGEVVGTGVVETAPGRSRQLAAPGGAWRGGGGQEFHNERPRNVPPRRGGHAGPRRTGGDGTVNLRVSAFSFG
jgi:hypothetical protein